MSTAAPLPSHIPQDKAVKGAEEIKKPTDFAKITESLSTMVTWVKGRMTNGHDATSSLRITQGPTEKAVNQAERRLSEPPPPLSQTKPPRATVIPRRTQSMVLQGTKTEQKMDATLSKQQDLSAEEKAFFATLPPKAQQALLRANALWESQRGTKSARPASAGVQEGAMTRTQRPASLPNPPVARSVSTTTLTQVKPRPASLPSTPTSLPATKGINIDKSAAKKLVADSNKALETYSKLKAKGDSSVKEAESQLVKIKTELVHVRTADPDAQKALTTSLSKIQVVTDEIAKNKLDVFHFHFDDVLKANIILNQHQSNLKEELGKPEPNEKRIQNIKQNITGQEGLLKEFKIKLDASYSEIENMRNLSPQLSERLQGYKADYRNFAAASDSTAFAERWKEDHRSLDDFRMGQMSQNTAIFSDGFPYRNHVDTSKWVKANEALKRRDTQNSEAIQTFTNQLTNMGKLYNESSHLGEFFTKGGAVVDLAGLKKSASQLQSSLNEVTALRIKMENTKKATEDISFTPTELSEAAQEGTKFLAGTIQNSIDRLKLLEEALQAQVTPKKG